MERDIFKMMEAAIATMQSYIQRGYVLANGLSGGKDSTCVMVLMLEAIRRTAHLFPDRRHYITSADTTIENPVMQNHLHAVLDEVEAYAEGIGLTIGDTLGEALPCLAVRRVDGWARDARKNARERGSRR